MERGEYAITSRGVFHHDHVTRLLTTESEPAFVHRFEYVPVPHLGLLDANPVVPHRLDEPEVAHHGGHHGVVFEPAGVP